MTTIGEKFLLLRTNSKLSQPNLAKILKTNHKNISSWERGKNTPDINTVIAYAKYFNVSTDYLLGLGEAPEKPDMIEDKIINLQSILHQVVNHLLELSQNYSQKEQIFKIMNDTLKFLEGSLHWISFACIETIKSTNNKGRPLNLDDMQMMTITEQSFAKRSPNKELLKATGYMKNFIETVAILASLAKYDYFDDTITIEVDYNPDNMDMNTYVPMYEVVKKSKYKMQKEPKD